MIVIYVQDQEIALFQGRFYHSKSAHFFERYLSGLNDSDRLIVYTGAKEIKDRTIVEKFSCVSHERIKFRIIPEFRKIKNIFVICRIMRQAVREADFCYLRCGIASSFAGFFCHRYDIPYMTIVNEDVYKSGINHSNLMVRLSAYPLVWASKYVVRHASYSCYVTQCYLQSNYPCCGEMLGCSDIESLEINSDCLKKRREHIYEIKDTIILGSAGNVSTVIKGHDVVIRAMAELKRDGYENYIYMIVGSGSPSKLRSLAVTLGVDDKIQFLGQYSHDDMLKWFETIDVYLHPSRSEGLPRTILEAMTKATPCICSEVGGIPELISKDFLFSYNGHEVEQLKNLILKMRKDRMIIESESNFEKSKQYDPCLLEAKRSAFFINAINQNRTGIS